jgi:isopentenyl-diphosphate delta-isomerase
MGRINIDKIEDTLDLMSSRKNDHIHICKTQNVESKKNEPFEAYHFAPSALPELDFSEVSARQTFLGHTFSYPILITGMTGGVQQGQEINEILAIIAEKYKIPIGLGSQKIMLKDPSLKRLFDVRKKAPKAFLIGNMGAVSLNYEVSIRDIEFLVETLSLNAFAIHLNPLQECIQPEGERNFSNLLSKIESLAKKLPVPIMVKEVGSGISAQTFQDLNNAGIKAIDVGGNGGTSWSVIEGQ